MKTKRFHLHTRSRSIVCTFLVLVFMTLAGQRTHAQTTSQPRMPDIKEFKANPTFFSAQNSDQRCNAIDVWLSSMRYEAKQLPYFSQESRAGEFDLERIGGETLMQVGTPAFRGVFGKGLPELNAKTMARDFSVAE